MLKKIGFLSLILVSSFSYCHNGIFPQKHLAAPKKLLTLQQQVNKLQEEVSKLKETVNFLYQQLYKDHINLGPVKTTYTMDVDKEQLQDLRMELENAKKGRK